MVSWKNHSDEQMTLLEKFYRVCVCVCVWTINLKQAT
jgi:hypothetical protein